MRVFCETRPARRTSMINPNNIHTQAGSQRGGCQCQYCRTAKLHALCHTTYCVFYQSKPVQGENVMQAPRPTYLLAAYLCHSRTVFSLVRPLCRPSAVLVVLDLLRDLAVICGTSLLYRYRHYCWWWWGCRSAVVDGSWETGDGSDVVHPCVGECVCDVGYVCDVIRSVASARTLVYHMFGVALFVLILVVEQLRCL